MTANDDSPIATAWHPHDHRFLREGSVWKHFGRDAVLPRLLDDVCDLCKQPLGCLRAGLSLREACVIRRRIVLEVLLDVIPAKLGNQAPDVLLVLELLGIRRLLFYRTNLGIEFGDVEEMTSAAAALSAGQYQAAKACWAASTDVSSHRSSSVICRVSPGATSMVRRALGLICSGFASTAVAQAAMRMEAAFIMTAGNDDEQDVGN
jgi:hypothetical protein